MELLSAEKYSVIMGENNKSFTLSFNESVNERYAVTFTTSVPDTSQKTYTNTATLKVGDKEYPYTGSIGFDKADNKLSKDSLNTEGNEVYTDDEIDWKIKINESLSIVDKDVKVVDTISNGMVYKEGSLEVYKLQGTERIPVEEKTEYTLKQSINKDGETVLEILFADSISSTYEIEYKTVVTATEGKKINNTVEYSGKNDVIDSVITKKLKAEQFSYVGGEWNPEQGAIVINKVDSKGNAITAEAEFEVYYMLNDEERLVSGESFKTDGEGKIEVPNLVLGNTYYIREIKAPNGFKFDERFRRLGIKIEDKAGEDNQGAYIENIVNENIKISKRAEKTWEGGPEDDRPTVELQLYRNVDKLGDPVELKNGTMSYTWENLNKTDNAGVDYEYTVKEVNTPAGYTKTK